MKRWMKIGLLVLVIGLIGATAALAHGNGMGRGGDGTAPGMGRGGMGRGFGGGEMLTIVAETLGIETDALVTELQAGTTIAAIAEENGVELSAVVDAIVANHTENLTAAVEAGTLTQAQADARTALLQADLEVRLTEPFTFGRGMGRGHHGMWGTIPATPAPEATAEAAA